MGLRSGLPLPSAKVDCELLIGYLLGSSLGLTRVDRNPMTFNEQSPGDRPILDDRAQAAVVYILYLLALGTAFTALIGFVLAWMARTHAGEMARSHFTFQIRTVLIGLGYVVVGAVLTIFWVGYLILARRYL